jgi:aerobic carbon-monoxide dehydrogenase medium subunit
MITHDFEYFAPTTLTEAFGLLADPGAKALAGGMSLVPMMKLRMAAPEKLVDLRGIAELHSIREANSMEDAGKLEIGAMVTHYELESAPLVRAKCPLLAASAAAIGDVQIRNAGTLGGSVAHADPAADYPAALLALEAEVRITAPNGQRTVTFEDFVLDPFTTLLEPGELVTSILVPVEADGVGSHYQKHAQPASGFPMVGAAARIAVSSGAISFARVAVTGLSGKGYRARKVEEALLAGADPKAACEVLTQGIEASSDIHASAEYRAHLARVAGARAIVRAKDRAS